MRALREESSDADIPMTPLIDIVFLLLIFFLAATTFARREFDQQVRLPRAEAGAPSAPEPEILVLNVREDGTVTLNGQVAEEAELRHALRGWRARHPDRPAAVRGDARAPYQAVMRVLGLCRAEGVEQVDLPVLEPQAGA